MKRKHTAFDYFNYIFLAVVCFTTFYPFWTQLIISFSTPEEFFRNWFHILPKSFSVQSYGHSFRDPQVFRSLFISVLLTAFGTATSLIMTTMASYFLSKSYLRGRNIIFFLFVLTYFISGGLIPFYLVVVKLGMRNTLFALFIPYSINIYFVILMKNYFHILLRTNRANLSKSMPA